MGEKDNLPREIPCQEHKCQAKLVGWDSDGFGVYECPHGHGIYEDGVLASSEAVKAFRKL